jgi:uncharacterized protein YejL (UPF0352 family)
MSENSLLSSIPESFKSNFSFQVAGELKSQYPLHLADISAVSLAGVIQTILAAILPREVSLVKTRPDFDSILVQLMNEVEQSKAWVDADLSATGQMILRAIATDIAYGQFSIARALQETYIDTARSPYSVYLGARMLGNRLTRSTPAQVTVELGRDDFGTLAVIPRYTPFSVGGQEGNFFNRYPITFAEADTALEVVLHEGIPKTTSVVSSGVPYQVIEIGNETWKASDVDLVVNVNGENWPRTTRPLWEHLETDKVFYETTLPNGNISIQFGNNMYGASPAVDAIIDITWVETSGSGGNDSVTGYLMTAQSLETGLAAFEGVTLTPVTGGTDARPAEHYKLFASNIRAARDRAVRRSDYRALASSYPGVVDSRFRGQAELNPGRPSWMNVIGATLITSTVWSESAFSRFVEYMNEHSIYQTAILRYEPEVIASDVVADVYCRPEANLEVVKARLQEQFLEATKPKAGTLGYSWYMSDLNDILEGKGDLEALIEYVTISTPTTHLICDTDYKWVRFDNLTLNMAYTRREGYAGRLDNSVILPNTGGIKID